MGKETGGPAFPREDYQANGYGDDQFGKHLGQEGMTLRDYFAAKAMQALITEVLARCEGMGANFPDNNLGLAKASYEIADAMLRVRDNNSKRDNL